MPSVTSCDIEPDNYDDWGIDTTEQFNSGSEIGHYLKSARLRHRKTENDVQWSFVAPRGTQQHAKTSMGSTGSGEPQNVEPDRYIERVSGVHIDTEQSSERDPEIDLISGETQYLEPSRYVEEGSGVHLDTDQGTEQDTEAGVGSGELRYVEPERFLERKYRAPVDTEQDTEADLGFEEPQYIEPDRYIERGSGVFLDTEQHTETNVGSGEPRYLEAERFTERDSGTPLVILPSKEKIAARHGPEDVRHRGVQSTITPKPLTIPGSDIRWTGLTLAHRKSNDQIISANKGKDKKQEQKEGGLSIIATTFVAAGVFLLLMMISFFVFAWYVQHSVSKPQTVIIR